MSETASLDLCKELYEVSDFVWVATSLHWVSPITGPKAGKWTLNETIPNAYDFFPAYDLGYLSRKIPAKYYNLIHVVDTPEYLSYIYKNGAVQKELGADNPEDCLAQLAIELFKQGILTKGTI